MEIKIKAALMATLSVFIIIFLPIAIGIYCNSVIIGVFSLLSIFLVAVIFYAFYLIFCEVFE